MAPGSILKEVKKLAVTEIREEHEKRLERQKDMEGVCMYVYVYVYVYV